MKWTWINLATVSKHGKTSTRHHIIYQNMLNNNSIIVHPMTIHYKDHKLMIVYHEHIPKFYTKTIWGIKVQVSQSNKSMNFNIHLGLMGIDKKKY